MGGLPLTSAASVHVCWMRPAAVWAPGGVGGVGGVGVCGFPVAAWARVGAVGISGGGMGSLPFCILGLIYRRMMKSAIVAVKGTTLDYGQKEVCRRPTIPNGSTESETYVLHV